MAAIVEVKYFNSFVLKKQPENGTNDLIWNGSLGIPGNTTYGPGFRRNSNINEAKAWIIEEARIRGGYNNTSTDYGVISYLVEPSFITNGALTPVSTLSQTEFLALMQTPEWKPADPTE